jgi:hypothetical protein
MAAVCPVAASLSSAPREPPALATYHGWGLNAYAKTTS